jgi:hypothetical protein
MGKQSADEGFIKACKQDALTSDSSVYLHGITPLSLHAYIEGNAYPLSMISAGLNLMPNPRREKQHPPNGGLPR